MPDRLMIQFISFVEYFNETKNDELHTNRRPL